MGHALSGQAEDTPVLCFRRNFQGEFAFKRRHLYFAAQYGYRQRHTDGRVQVIAVSLEGCIRQHRDDQVKVAAGASVT